MTTIYHLMVKGYDTSEDMPCLWCKDDCSKCRCYTCILDNATCFKKGKCRATDEKIDIVIVEEEE